MGYVLCAASDTSMYCNLTKMFNVLSKNVFDSDKKKCKINWMI